MVLVDPTITLRVKAVFVEVPPTVKVSPPGTVWKVSATIRGSRRRVTVLVSPPESVAVSRSSRYAGASWSGATKDPVAVPAKLWMMCVWQLDGQCWTSRSHDSAEAGSAPSCASVA